MTTSTYTVATIFLFGLVLSGCEKSSAPDKAVSVSSAKDAVPQVTVASPSPPHLNIEVASPDLAVKSWWKVLDLRDKILTEECNKNKLKEKPIYFVYYPKIAQEEMLRVLMPKEITCREDVFEREILEVKTESETRAIVFAKVRNITPIPVGAEPDEHDKRYRNDGFRFKYLVEKASEGWKVSQVYKYEEMNKYLKKDPWDRLYQSSDKPYVPAFIHLH